MRLTFTGEMFEWRGPSPFYFVAVPAVEAERIRGVSSVVTYGWGVIPATVKIGDTSATTSLFPKDGGYLVPIKNALRLPEKIALGDAVDIIIDIAV